MTFAPRPSRFLAAGRLLLSRLAIGGMMAGAAPFAGALDIQFDYSFDANNFFIGHLDRQAVLEAAGQVFESRFTDALTGIVPGGGNTWSAIFDNPATGTEQTVNNPTIAANVIRVFAGGRQLGTNTLGVGGPGGFSSSGFGNWNNTVRARGQAGALALPRTDFGPWGGAISFDLDAVWYFDANPLTLENFAGKNDFYSVAVHELGHVLGFGTAESLDALISGTNFIGSAGILEYGGPVPLDGDLAHWMDGTLSSVSWPVSLASQETAMSPSITVGTRKYFTDLDFAAMDDLGWTLVPEPGSGFLALSGALTLATRRRRR